MTAMGRSILVLNPRQMAPTPGWRADRSATWLGMRLSSAASISEQRNDMHSATATLATKMVTLRAPPAQAVGQDIQSPRSCRRHRMLRSVCLMDDRQRGCPQRCGSRRNHTSRRSGLWPVNRTSLVGECKRPIIAAYSIRSGRCPPAETPPVLPLVNSRFLPHPTAISNSRRVCKRRTKSTNPARQRTGRQAAQTCQCSRSSRTPGIPTKQRQNGLDEGAETSPHVLAR